MKNSPTPRATRTSKAATTTVSSSAARRPHPCCLLVIEALKSRRRSFPPRHSPAAGGGLITLAVAITSITPVWLAVGPLLLVILDTLAYSPSVRKRVSILAGPVGRRAGSSLLAWPKTEAVWVAYSLAERRSTLLRLLATLILGVGVAAAVSFLPLYVWLGIVIGLLAIGAVRMFAFRWGLLPDGGLAEPAARSHAGSEALSASDSSLSGPPEAWLQLQLREAGDGPLSIAVIGFMALCPLARLAALVTAIANTRDTASTTSPPTSSWSSAASSPSTWLSQRSSGVPSP